MNASSPVAGENAWGRDARPHAVGRRHSSTSSTARFAKMEKNQLCFRFPVMIQIPRVVVPTRSHR